MKRLIAITALLACSTFASAQTFTREPDGITVRVHDQIIRLQVITDSIIHVSAKPIGAPTHPSIAVVAQPSTTVKWTAIRAADSIANTVTLSTARIRATVNTDTGAVNFLDATTYADILAESTRTITPAAVLGERTWNVQQQWQPITDESLFGLGLAAARHRRPQGLRPRPLAAQHQRRRSLPRLQPRLWHLLGQHLLHALRRSTPLRRPPCLLVTQQRRHPRRPHTHLPGHYNAARQHA